MRVLTGHSSSGWLALICVGLLLSRCDSASAETVRRRAHKETAFGTGLKVGNGLLRFQNSCIWFELFFASGDFFAGLREVTKGKNVEFKTEKAVQQNFPEHVVLDIQATVFRCQNVNSSPEGPEYGSGLMEDASFDLRWETPNGEESVTLLSKQEHHDRGLRWDYYLGFSGKDVPLTDTLLVDISLRRGTAKTRLLAGFK